VGDIDQLRYRKLRPMGPRNRAETGESGVGDGLGEPIRIDSAVLRLDDANLDALSFEALPREDSSRMLEIRPDDEVAGLPVDRVGDRVDPGRGAFSECDFVRFGADERRDPLSSAVKRLKRSLVGVVPDRLFVLMGADELVGGVDDVLRARSVGAKIEVNALIESGNVRPEFGRRHRRIRLHTVSDEPSR